TIALNGNNVNANIDPATGNFSATLDAHLLNVAGSPYTVSYSYPGDTVCGAAASTSTVTVANVISVWYVNQNASGPVHDGTSWSTAFTDLQAALAAAQSGSEIWVAKGRYIPSQPGDVNTSFVLRSGAAVYGGFAGSEVNRADRDWKLNETILSGDLNGD